MNAKFRRRKASRSPFQPPVIPLFLLVLVPFLPRQSPAMEARAKERRGTVTIAVTLNAPAEARHVRLWIPWPASDADQDITDAAVSGNYAASSVSRDGPSGVPIFYAEWREPAAERTLTCSFRVVRKEAVRKDFPREEPSFRKEEFRGFLAPTRLGPTDGAVRELADEITAGKETTLEKAHAVYGWIVENMQRDPGVKGCGIGDVRALLASPGGKCADISSVFVALARAAGVPAREVFGIRLPAGPEGEMTRSQHCWAEFFLPGSGWVPADPADVRKAILEKALSPDEAAPYRDYFFGAVDADRIAFGTGRDVVLRPPQAGEPLNYFMYPYAEADGRPLGEDLFGFDIGYTITFREP
jgi:transglutaminase-like putative cysteine protease